MQPWLRRCNSNIASIRSEERIWTKLSLSWLRARKAKSYNGINNNKYEWNARGNKGVAIGVNKTYFRTTILHTNLHQGSLDCRHSINEKMSQLLSMTTASDEGKQHAATTSASLAYSTTAVAESSSSSLSTKPDPHTGYATFPSVPHYRLDVNDQQKVLIIGDVHGCFDELIDLVESNGFSKEGIIICVGDLIAKGPKSVDVIKWCMERGVKSVRGNHDHLLLQCADKIVDPTSASTNGHPSTVPLSKSFIDPTKPSQHMNIASELTSDQRLWLHQRPFTISIPKYNIVIVHAGLVPQVPLTCQSPFDMMGMRNITNEGKGTSNINEGSEWIKHWKGPEIVIFGHDAARELQLHPEGLAFGIDTGCCYGKCLTGYILPVHKLVYVNAHKQYTAIVDKSKHAPTS